MVENVYDDPAFQAEYQRLARSELGLDGAPEWPAVAALLSDLRGRDVVDLGCGYGAFARWAIDQGAARVDAFDLSERMLDRARSLTDEERVRYHRVDLEQLELSPASYDLAYSALVLHYLRDLDPFLARVHAALRPGGSFVLTTEHPIFTAPTDQAFINSGGQRVWPLDRYGEEGERIRDWLTAGVRKQHRTTGTLMNALVDAGFTVRRVLDWIPTEEQVNADPDLAEEITRPMFLIVAADR
jgi:SAM-dependent methyltransferase